MSDLISAIASSYSGFVPGFGIILPGKIQKQRDMYTKMAKNFLFFFRFYFILCMRRN